MRPPGGGTPDALGDITAGLAALAYVPVSAVSPLFLVDLETGAYFDYWAALQAYNPLAAGAGAGARRVQPIAPPQALGTFGWRLAFSVNVSAFVLVVSGGGGGVGWGMIEDL